MKKVLLSLMFLLQVGVLANDNSCSYANDNICDDGGEGSSFAMCSLGTDLNDCGFRGDRRGDRGSQACKQRLSELQFEYQEDSQRWQKEKIVLQDEVRRLQRQLNRRDSDRRDRRNLQCVDTNLYGKWARGGGCSVYGCFYAGGGCNVYGCWSTGGKCNVYGCIKQAPKTSKACFD